MAKFQQLGEYTPKSINTLPINKLLFCHTTANIQYVKMRVYGYAICKTELICFLFTYSFIYYVYKIDGETWERGKEYMREMGVTKKAKVEKENPNAKLHTLHCFG